MIRPLLGVVTEDLLFVDQGEFSCTEPVVNFMATSYASVEIRLDCAHQVNWKNIIL